MCVCSFWRLGGCRLIVLPSETALKGRLANKSIALFGDTVACLFYCILIEEICPGGMADYNTSALCVAK